jgi:hypothetical protein
MKLNSADNVYVVIEDAHMHFNKLPTPIINKFLSYFIHYETGAYHLIDPVSEFELKTVGQFCLKEIKKSIAWWTENICVIIETLHNFSIGKNEYAFHHFEWDEKVAENFNDLIPFTEKVYHSLNLFGSNVIALTCLVVLSDYDKYVVDYMVGDKLKRVWMDVKYFVSIKRSARQNYVTVAHVIENYHKQLVATFPSLYKFIRPCGNVSFYKNTPTYILSRTSDDLPRKRHTRQVIEEEDLPTQTAASSTRVSTSIVSPKNVESLIQGGASAELVEVVKMIHALKKTYVYRLSNATIAAIYTTYSGGIVIKLDFTPALPFELRNASAAVENKFNVNGATMESLCNNANVKVPWYKENGSFYLKCNVPKSYSYDYLFADIPKNDDGEYVFDDKAVDVLFHLDTYMNFPKPGDIGISCSIARSLIVSNHEVDVEMN